MESTSDEAADERARRADARDERARQRDHIADHREAVVGRREDLVGDRELVASEREIRLDHTEAQATVDAAVMAELRKQGVLDQAEIAHLREALRSARLIGAAIGIVMAWQRVTEDAAFAVLSEMSQRTNRKVRDLAEDIVTTGEVPARGGDVPHPLRAETET